jgi:hypothetical protein
MVRLQGRASPDEETARKEKGNYKVFDANENMSSKCDIS